MAKPKGAKRARVGSWGGRREGAGRKPTPGKLDPAHRARPEHDPRHPVWVVLRTVEGIRRLRQRAVLASVRAALEARGAQGTGRNAFRVVDAAILPDHVMLIVEAGSTDALSDGMRVVTIAIARAINVALERTGKVFAYRYQATAITTPAQAKSALAAVRGEWRMSGARATTRLLRAGN